MTNLPDPDEMAREILEELRTDKEFMAKLMKSFNQSLAKPLEDMPDEHANLMPINGSTVIELVHFTLTDTNTGFEEIAPKVPAIRVSARCEAGHDHGLTVDVFDFTAALFNLLAAHPLYTDWMMTILSDLIVIRALNKTISILDQSNPLD